MCLYVPADVAELVDALPPSVSRSALFARAVRTFARRYETCSHPSAVCDQCGTRFKAGSFQIEAAKPVRT